MITRAIAVTANSNEKLSELHEISLSPGELDPLGAAR
jgi:hypothetical protein